MILSSFPDPVGPKIRAELPVGAITDINLFNSFAGADIPEIKLDMALGIVSDIIFFFCHNFVIYNYLFYNVRKLTKLLIKNKILILFSKLSYLFLIFQNLEYRLPLSKK